MPSAADIIRDSINELSRIQDWMLELDDKNSKVYQSMYRRYLELKVTLNSLGVNLAEIDRIK